LIPEENININNLLSFISKKRFGLPQANLATPEPDPKNNSEGKKTIQKNH
jgi:hypothetical protein